MYNRKLEVAPIEGNNLIDTGKNWIEFCKVLRATKREGVEDLIKTLETTDFALAPASHAYHLSVKGGLCQHSLNTYEYALQLAGMVGLELDEESLIISGLLHDLCKVQSYKIKEILDKEYKDKTDQWRKKEAYVFESSFPTGHGTRSVILAQQWGIKLKKDEVLAIMYHMGFSDPLSQTKDFMQAWGEYPIVQIVAMADQLAVTHEDHVFMKNVKAKNLIKR